MKGKRNRSDTDPEREDEPHQPDVEELEKHPRRDLPVPRMPALASPPKGTTTTDLLQFYFAQVRRYPLLSPEEEKVWAKKYADSGDQEAANKLVTSNLRLVIKIAFQYHRQWANVLDLIQEGNVGLVEALTRYDPTREIRFSSYAQYWIRAMILRFLLDNFRIVRLGSTRAGRKLFFQAPKERNRLIAEGENPSSKRLAERLGVTEQEFNAVDVHMRAPALSLHAPAGDDPDGRSLSEVVPETTPQDPEENVWRTQLRDLVREKLAAFAETHIKDDRERAIWDTRMIVTDQTPLSELGERFGVSKERIRQVEVRLHKRLKEYLEEQFGDEIELDFSILG
jgi:RNA polymerase sigma-32 factor